MKYNLFDWSRFARDALHKQLTWCTVEQACGAPLHWYQRFFRWLGWP